MNGAGEVECSDLARGVSRRGPLSEEGAPLRRGDHRVGPSRCCVPAVIPANPFYLKILNHQLDHYMISPPFPVRKGKAAQMGRTGIG